LSRADEDSDDDRLRPEEDWHKQISRRLRKGTRWIKKKETLVQLPLLNIISLPLDTFIYLVSELDGDNEKLHQPLIVFMLRKEGPLQQLLVQMTKSLSRRDGVLNKYLQSQLDLQPEEQREQWWEEVGWTALVLTVAQAARVWFRMELPLQQFPVQMLSIVDKENTMEQRRSNGVLSRLPTLQLSSEVPPK